MTLQTGLHGLLVAAGVDVGLGGARPLAPFYQPVQNQAIPNGNYTINSVGLAGCAGGRLTGRRADLRPGQWRGHWPHRSHAVPDPYSAVSNQASVEHSDSGNFIGFEQYSTCVSEVAVQAPGR